MTAPIKLAQAEDLLAIILSAIKESPLWAGATLNHSENLGPGTRVCDVVLKTDSRKRNASPFLEKFWTRATCKTANARRSAFSAKEDSPSDFSMITYDRLAYIEVVRKVAEALNGFNVELEADQSWTWDQAAPQPDGSSTERKFFKLHIYLNGAAKFSAIKWLKTALEHVCTSQDPRADEDAFQLEKRIRGTKDCFGSSMNRRGVILDYPTLRQAQAATAAVYGDCKVTFAQRDTYHEATVVFP
jgi:hypothetical protein